MFFDPMYFVFIAPAMLLAFIAQGWIQMAYAKAAKMRASMTGAQAARLILDKNGMHDVSVEQTPGQLSDHYDPSARVVRLSPEVYGSPSLASVGIAAHEVGHAMQHAFGYVPLTIRNLAVPMASFGSGLGMLLLFAGIGLGLTKLAWAGIIVFSGVVFFQVINLPVEFNASTRGKQALVEYGIVDANEMGPVKSVLTAAALTYVAATLQTIMQLLYYISILNGRSSRDE